MKNAAIAMIALVLVVFTAVAINTTEGKTVRQNELDSNLDQALKKSMEILTVDQSYMKNQSESEFASDFIQDLLIDTTSDSTFTVEIKNIDVEKGILDTEVTETYKQVLGKGSVKARKKVILDDWENPENAFFQVSFQVEDDVVKQINVHGGDTLSSSVLPHSMADKKGYTLSGWKITSPSGLENMIYTEENIENITVTRELQFTAVFQKE